MALARSMVFNIPVFWSPLLTIHSPLGPEVTATRMNCTRPGFLRVSSARVTLIRNNFV